MATARPKIQTQVVKLLRAVTAISECIRRLPMGDPLRTKLQTAEANLLEVIRAKEDGE